MCFHTASRFIKVHSYSIWLFNTKLLKYASHAFRGCLIWKDYSIMALLSRAYRNITEIKIVVFVSIMPILGCFIIPAQPEWIPKLMSRKTRLIEVVESDSHHCNDWSEEIWFQVSIYFYFNYFLSDTLTVIIMMQHG
jgi:hypothetical protein